jgi:hypothetical protein
METGYLQQNTSNMETQTATPTIEVVKEAPFLTQKDYDTFERNGRDLDASIAVFLFEIQEYLNYKWAEKHHIKEPIKSMDQLNQEYLLGYPSSGGDALLDDAFTGDDCPIEKFSQSTFEVLAYFYNFHLD